MTVACRPLPEASRRVREVVANATLLGRSEATAGLAAFTLERDQPLEPFLPGQYVSVGVIDGGRLLQRAYSVVSLDGRGRVIELLIKRLADGQLSPRLWRLALGARLRVGPARGLFTWPVGETRDHVFIAAGTGIAPFMAMLDEAARAASTSNITLVHGVSFADELTAGGRIERLAATGLKVDYRPSISRPADPRNAGWAGSVGRAEDQLRVLLDEPGVDLSQLTFWLCGGGDMIENCGSRLSGAGVIGSRIRSETFHLAR